MKVLLAQKDDYYSTIQPPGLRKKIEPSFLDIWDSWESMCTETETQKI